jgi:hypothetical protein
MIVLDTNVLSELMRPTPSLQVAAWLDEQKAGEVYTTALTQAEILVGLALLPVGQRRDALSAAAASMFSDELGGRILAFDSPCAAHFAEIVAARRTAGRPIAQIDAQIAAIVRHNGASLVTRNLPDFEGCGIRLINPSATDPTP